MKRKLPFYLRSVLLLGMFLMMGKGAYANHILGMDLSYQWVSGNTYTVILTAYGDCGNSVFPSLDTSAPTICVYNGNTSVTTLTLTIAAPTTGTAITPVCIADTGMTTCTSPTATIAGVKKFVYTATYTLPSTSNVWRFVFNGNMKGTFAGRASTITNTTGVTVIQLIDTLNNTTVHNTSPDLTVVPTPYFCLNNNDNYNPGAVDPDGDSLRFFLVAGKVGNSTTPPTCTLSGTTVTYVTGYSSTAPLSTNTGTFSFSSATGQVAFNPNIAQRSLVVYNVEEYRGGVLVGTSQREMTFVVQTCTNTPPNGPISTASAGTIVDSTHFQMCQNTGAFTFHVDPTETNPGSNIKITASSLPTGSTFTVTGDSTNAPIGTFSWTSTGVTPGTYTFFLYFLDDNCPISGSNSVAYTVTIEPTPLITGPTVVCTASTVTLSNNVTGGTWSSSTSSVATIGLSTGIATGTYAGSTSGATIITYTSPAGCIDTSLLNVNPIPATITGSSSVCVGSTIILSDGSTGGTWTTGSPGIATITPSGSNTSVIGVASGQSVITYKFATTGCATTTTVSVNPLPGNITGVNSVCAGLTTNLTDATTGGTWSSSNTFATVNSSGAVIGQTAGTSVITYTTATGCIATTTVTINALPAAILPAGAVSVCIGTVLGLSDAVGGTWSSSTPGQATVNGVTGAVTGVTTGTPVITYTNATGCIATKTVTVNTAPTAILPNPATVCTGFTVTLSDGISGGNWSSSNSNAIINSSGVATGQAAGPVTITYAIGTCTVTSSLTVLASPPAIDPLTAVSICIGTTATLSDATTGGVWSSSSSALATVSALGVVTGVSSGAPVITYTQGGCFATKSVTVNTTPTAILPASASVCVTATAQLSDAVAGGAWSSANTSATINSSGVITGVNVGTAVITYAIGTCTVSASVTVNPQPVAGSISGTANLCIGTNVTLSDGASGGVWSSSVSSFATVSAVGVVSGAAAGTDVISYSVTNGCGTAVATYTVLVSSTAGAGTITGSSTICAGTFTSLTSTVPGGTWSVFNANASISAVGLLTGNTPGTDTVYYSVTNACGAYVSKMFVTIGAFLTAGSVSGATNVCVGSSVTLSDGTPGGVWSSTNTNVATISGLGVVTGESAGTVVISYLMISSCGSTAATYTFTVNPLPVAGTIIGPSTICAGTFSLLSDGATGGTWSTSNAGLATITSGGLAYGVSAGSVTISYTVTNVCGTAYATQLTTIAPAPALSGISGASVVCTGASVTLSDATAGGVWSSSNGHATVSAGGMVTGVTAGADTIIYSLTTGCGTVSVDLPMTVVLTPTPGTITGGSSVCVTYLLALSDASAGGVWSSSNGHATITTAGVLTGITPGTDTITYSILSACGLVSTTHIVTVNPSTGAGTILGPVTVCPGASVALSDAITGGVWSVSNSAVATISSTGVLHGVSNGTDSVIYTLVSGCGTNIASTIITVGGAPAVAPIGGASSVCVGSAITLSEATTGGVWSASNGDATVSGGVVTGVTGGTDIISYSVSSSCGVTVATKTVAVQNFPFVTLIEGGSTVCVGASISLSNATAGGVWTNTTGDASVSTAGVVTGVAAGADIITYLLTNSCGTVGTSKNITINPVANPGTITGPDSLCAGTTITLVDVTPGGVWSSGNGNATVSGGIVTGVSAGTVPISYSATNSCGTVSAIQIVTVLTPPTAGTITGPSSVCIGAGITLGDATPGGTWLSSNGTAVIVVPGIVDGVSVGIDTVFYLANNMCGASVASKVINVNPNPVVTAISGPTSQCVGTIIALSDATTGGQWSSSNPSEAAIDMTTGITNGVSAGIVSISYTVTNGFGCPATAIAPDTVNIVPVTAPITGSGSVCEGSIVALSDATSGGVWTGDNNLVATIDAAGNITGVAPGTVNITYTVVNICGTTVMTTSETVNSLPVVAAISNTANICIGASVGLSDATAGGVWNSSSPAIASVDAAGVVTGVSGGSVNINYTVTSPLGCTASAIAVETVNTLPVTTSITGPINVCIGGMSTLSDATTGGVWSSSNLALATIDPSTGVVTGVVGGTLVITYTITTGSGCSASATTPYIVNTMPLPTAVTGNMSVCVGGSTILSNSVSGGAWSAANGNASVSAGTVTGVTAGTDYIVYAVTNPCGTVLDSALVTIIASPVVAGIATPATTICAGTTVAMTETTTGGVWSSSNTAVATVSGTGVVTAIAAGTATIMYSVTNGTGCTGVAFVAITVGAALPSSINITPTGSATLCNGNSVYLNVTVAGSGITYQWYTGSTAITGATDSSYNAATAGTYSVTISNGTCSETVTGTVVIPAPNPVITLSSTDTLSVGTFATYQWFLNGVLIPGDTTSTIVETTGGDYTVVVTDGNGCSDTSVAYASVSAGVNAVAPVQNIKVYPNPATSVLHIDAPMKVNVSVLGVDGKVLIRQKDAVDIDIHSLADGMYVIMIYDQDNVFIKTTKFAKTE